MLKTIASLFTRNQPKREVISALTRIVNRIAASALMQNVAQEYRQNSDCNVALGVWLFPCSPSPYPDDTDFSGGVPAVTQNLRPEGFGILTPVPLPHENFIVAVKDDHRSDWQFFGCRVRHNTAVPGGWYQLGLNAECLIDLDKNQWGTFRQHVEAVTGSSNCALTAPPRDEGTSGQRCSRYEKNPRS